MQIAAVIGREVIIGMAGTATGLGQQTLSDYLRACFAAGTPILWEDGEKPVEDFQPGEGVWARDEHEPNGPLVLKEIEESFDRTGRIWHVDGQVIRTTDEHPFWVQGKGWTAARELEIGDLLVSHDGQVTPVEDLLDTGTYKIVYKSTVGPHQGFSRVFCPFFTAEALIFWVIWRT